MSTENRKFIHLLIKMDLPISAFLLFILFTAGHSLSCYECSGQTGSCVNKKVKTCPKGFSKCMSTTAVTQIGDISAKVKVKDCVVDCATGSMNLGIIKRSTKCCNTDRCNSQDAPDPSNDSNGKTCYYCDGKNCSNIVSCTGSEDRCITATATYGEQSLVIKGCASKAICDTTTSVDDVQRISCCSGNLCNGARSVTKNAKGGESITQSVNGAESVTQSVLFLFCFLLFFILLH